MQDEKQELEEEMDRSAKRMGRAEKLRDINEKDLEFLEINRQRYVRLANEYRLEQYHDKE